MQVVVIGGGAAGMMAAATSASYGNNVILLEKNEKLGKKLYITGKGRCNLTNNCTPKELLENVVRGNKFLLGAANRFTSEDTVSLCERYGCDVKTERGRRVFPASDKAGDFIKALERQLYDFRVDVRLGTLVTDILVADGVVRGVKLVSQEIIECDKVILATGGLSYPATGSTGDGYAMAKAAGHGIIPLRPALINVDLKDDVSSLAGVSLKNVSAKIIYKESGKAAFEEFGELLFTHTGVSGPIILTLSSKINREDLDKIELSLDLKPAISYAEMDGRLLNIFKAQKNKQFKNILSELTIKALNGLIISASGVSADKPLNSITREERSAIIKAFKDIRFGIKKLGDIKAAIVTSGGIDISEINPKDMQSKIVKGLYFAGEVMDVDALTGGYNIQIALSTGYVAGADY